MTLNKNSTNNNKSELPFNICGKSGDVELEEGADYETIEALLVLCRKYGLSLRIVKKEAPICPDCNKPMTRNGTKSVDINKTDSLKLQKYGHKNCEDSSCMCSTESFKEEKHTYTDSIKDKSITINLVNPESYQKKAEEIANQTGAYPHRSTLYKYHERYSDVFFDYLENLQFQKIEQLNITPSGVYCYDEQYIFINKKLYLRLTIIDYKNKLIMGDEIVSEEDFNDKTIENFLKTKLENQPLKCIVTDGRQGYKTIIEAIGAIQHRCFFHIMQNLTTPLQKHINHLNRRIKTLNTQITKNETKIKNIKVNKKKYHGPIPKKDKKTRKQHAKIKQLYDENKEAKKEIKQIEKELDDIDYDKTRIQNIWESKTIKQAKRRYNTIHNQKEHLNPIISKFLDKIEADIDIILNHIIDPEIPATNNTVENYYRTTLPRSQKRIFRTLNGLKRRIKEQQIRWTHRIVLKQNTPINKNTTYN